MKSNLKTKLEEYQFFWIKTNFNKQFLFESKINKVNEISGLLIENNKVRLCRLFDE